VDTNDLEIDIIGTADKILVNDWFLNAGNQLDRVEVAGAYAQANDVQALVSAMAAFTGGPPPLGQTTLDPTRASALGSTLAASWHAS